LWKAGGEGEVVAGTGGEAKKGSDFVHSVVYWAAVFRVAPRAERRGEVVALLYEVGGEEAEE
jgi:hypothetical protein